MGFDVSVVVPCRDGSGWVAEALGSVERQSVPAREVILVDDGSTDASVERAREACPRVRVLVGGGRGVSAARNLGVAAAEADWIALLDADDWWRQDHLERAARCLALAGDSIFLGSTEHYSIRASRIVSRSDPGPFTEPTGAVPGSSYFELLRRHGFLQMSATVIRRECLSQEPFDESLRGAEDLELMLRLMATRTLAFDPHPTCVYRCSNPQSLSRRTFLADLKLQVLARHREAHAIDAGYLRQTARTVASRACSDASPTEMRRALTTARPWLSRGERLMFEIASRCPTLWRMLTRIRDRVRAPRYPPRIEAPTGEDPE